MKYHLLHPNYLLRRIKELGKYYHTGGGGGYTCGSGGGSGYRLRLVVCLVDAEELKALLEINKMALQNGERATNSCGAVKEFFEHRMCTGRLGVLCRFADAQAVPSVLPAPSPPRSRLHAGACVVVGGGGAVPRVVQGLRAQAAHGE